MTTLQKACVGVTLAAAIGAAVYQGNEISRLRQEVAAARGGSTVTAGQSNTALAGLQAKVERLENENATLSSALAQSKSDQKTLAAKAEAAEGAKSLYQTLATMREESKATNPYPTMRHLMVGMGRFGRIAAELKRDESEMSEEQKAANKKARAAALAEIGPMLKAMHELDQNKPEGEDDGPSPDSISCMLYGMLNLSEQQFGEVYNLMDSFMQRKKALGDEETPEKVEEFNRLMADGMTDLKRLLSAEQGKIFDEALPSFDMSMKSFKFDFSINDK